MASLRSSSARALAVAVAAIGLLAAAACAGSDRVSFEGYSPIVVAPAPSASGATQALKADGGSP